MYSKLSSDELIEMFKSGCHDLKLGAEICSRAGLARQWARDEGSIEERRDESGFYSVLWLAIQKLTKIKGD